MIGTNKIGVVILNYNDAETTLHLCDLIRGYSAIDHIAVVDNLSPDGSYETLKHTGGAKIDVIQTDRNGGYSYGNNFGAFYLIDTYQADILFIANPDVEFTEDFMRRIVDDMEKYEAQAASGYMQMPKSAPKVVLNRKINSFWREALDCTILLKKVFPFKGEEVRRGRGIVQVEWIPGSLFAIDADVFRELNGLDDSVFLYYEEQILGEKFIQHGYRMIVDSDISYQHNHSVSINKAMKRLAQVRQLYKSKFYFYSNYKKIGCMKRVLLKALIAYGLFMRKILYKVMEGKRNE